MTLSAVSIFGVDWKPKRPETLRRGHSARASLIAASNCLKEELSYGRKHLGQS